VERDQHARAAAFVGEAVRKVYDRDSESLKKQGIEFACTLIFGGQIPRERCRLFQVYSAGNFIEAQDENLYFQIGESKYGKPIIDRVVTPATTLDEAASARSCRWIRPCAAIFPSAYRSICCATRSIRCVTRFVTITPDNELLPDGEPHLGPAPEAGVRRASRSHLGERRDVAAGARRGAAGNSSAERSLRPRSRRSRKRRPRPSRIRADRG